MLTGCFTSAFNDSVLVDLLISYAEKLFLLTSQITNNLLTHTHKLSCGTARGDPKLGKGARGSLSVVDGKPWIPKQAALLTSSKTVSSKRSNAVIQMKSSRLRE